MPLSANQRHALLTADRTRDVGTAAMIEKLLEADPETDLLEVELALRKGRAHAYLVAGPPLSIVLDTLAWIAALAEVGTTAAENRAALAGKPARK